MISPASKEIYIPVKCLETATAHQIFLFVSSNPCGQHSNPLQWCVMVALPHGPLSNASSSSAKRRYFCEVAPLSGLSLSDSRSAWMSTKSTSARLRFITKGSGLRLTTPQHHFYHLPLTITIIMRIISHQCHSCHHCHHLLQNIKQSSNYQS